MKNLAFFFFFTACVPGMFLAIAFYIGLFHPVKINEVLKEPAMAVVLTFEGDYQKVGKNILEVQNILSKKGVKCTPIAIYYDDEDKVAKRFLRSEGGCVIKKALRDLPKKFKILRFSRQEVVEAVIKAHPAVAKTKVFSALKTYSREKSIPLKRPIIALFEGDKASFYFYKSSQKTDQ